jgi:hypothetical protein
VGTVGTDGTFPLLSAQAGGKENLVCPKADHWSKKMGTAISAMPQFSRLRCNSYLPVEIRTCSVVVGPCDNSFSLVGTFGSQ